MDRKICKEEMILKSLVDCRNELLYLNCENGEIIIYLYTDGEISEENSYIQILKLDDILKKCSFNKDLAMHAVFVEEKILSNTAYTRANVLACFNALEKYKKLNNQQAGKCVLNGDEIEELLNLVRVEHKKYADVAEKFGISTKTVQRYIKNTNT